jgi:hypothetical protein
MPLDLTWDVLPPGVHNGVITEVDFKFGSTIGIVITYRVPHNGADYFVSEWLTLDAQKNSPSYNETAQGKGRLKQLYDAHRVPLPKALEPAEIINKLVGKTYRLLVSTKRVNGLAAPKVTGILGPADKPVPPKAADFPDDLEAPV